MSWEGELPEISGVEHIFYFNQWAWDLVEELNEAGIPTDGVKNWTLMELAELSYQLGRPLIKILPQEP